MERKNSFEWITEIESALSFQNELSTLPTAETVVERELKSEQTNNSVYVAEKKNEDGIFYISIGDSKSFQKFVFEGSYENKKERVLLLRQSFLNLGFSGHTKGVQDCFLTKRLKLNPFETQSLVCSLRGKEFFYLCKFFQIQSMLENAQGNETKNVFLKSLSWVKPKADSEYGSKDNKVRKKIRLFGEDFQIIISAPIFQSIVTTTNVLTNIDTAEKKCLWNLGWSKDLNRARYRLAKHITEQVFDENKTLKFFLLRHRIQCSKKKKIPTKSSEEKKRGREEEIFEEDVPQKKKQHFYALQSSPKDTATIIQAPEWSETESTQSDDTEPTETQEVLQIVTEQEVTPPAPSFTQATRERRRDAEPEIESQISVFHFRGPNRWDEVEEVFKARREPFVPLTNTQKRAWLYVCMTGLALLLFTVLLDYDIVPMVEYDIYLANDFLACFTAFFIGVALTCANPEKWSNVLTFLVFSFLCLWAGKGRLKAFKFPAVSYVCCSMAVLLYRKEKKWILALPATGFVVAVACGYYYSIFEIFSRCCAIVFTATSFLVEFRKGQCQWHKILVSPIRDICFIIFCPFYIFIEIGG